MIAGLPAAQAAVTTYNVVETFYEPDTQPRNTLFTGSFTYDDVGQTVSDLTGWLTESMTGTATGDAPYYDMTQLYLSYQLSAVYDAELGGLLVTTFLNDNTNTFTTMLGGDGWSPDSHGGSGLYYGFPGSNPGNAYAMIFVNTSDPTAALTQAQIDKLAYADCAPGGMMGATCMTGTTEAGYGSIGTMSGYPVSQVITAAVPEPETYAMLLAGFGVMGYVARRRRVA
ncbi:PEP-CTERM sorting domain-containing protein [Parasulfuritortus cantonensis]|uniref:PEP-CTERM sorting domain-containing protein n=2 Tax=Parasulfuritortus cantonensis TaxID=2528202 RepID=A0A4R1B869_9PROT|nr:PEP-CTERM sorting domain-containing protein [Parasulfuritortus cantonensis]